MTRFHIVSLFPEVCRTYCETSILGRAQEQKLISISYTNPRDFAQDKHQKADNRPYGGGPGMVMIAEPLLLALEELSKNIKRTALRSRPKDLRNPIPQNRKKKPKIKVILFSPRGTQFTNVYAKNLVTKYTDIVLVAGRYEGIDARVKKIFKAEEVSVGPFVLTGGEVPAMIVVDACARQIEGVLGALESLEEARPHSGQLAGAEVYTRPEVLSWKGKNYRVPKVLLGGDPKKIEEWKERGGGGINA